jgi:TrmH family RNA methyltransferase
MREAEQAFVAEGLRVVEAAVLAEAPIDTVFISAEGRGNQVVEDLAGLVLRRGARVFELGPGVMEKVAATVTPQPICAIVKALDVPISQLPASDGAGGHLVVVCVDVRDPGNLGAVMRSASASGAAGIVACAGCVDPYNAKAVRASAGSIFTMPLVKGDEPAEVFGRLRERGYSLWGTSVQGGVDYMNAPLGEDIALVLGNEANGLPPALAATLDGNLTIPMAPGNESLNVAMSATVLCFEAARRRRAERPRPEEG